MHACGPWKESRHVPEGRAIAFPPLLPLVLEPPAALSARRPSAVAAPASDACSIATKADVEAALGKPVGEGEPMKGHPRTSAPATTGLRTGAPSVKVRLSLKLGERAPRRSRSRIRDRCPALATRSSHKRGHRRGHHQFDLGWLLHHKARLDLDTSTWEAETARNLARSRRRRWHGYEEVDRPPPTAGGCPLTVSLARLGDPGDAHEAILTAPAAQQQSLTKKTTPIASTPNPDRRGSACRAGRRRHRGREGDRRPAPGRRTATDSCAASPRRRPGRRPSQPPGPDRAGRARAR